MANKFRQIQGLEIESSQDTDRRVQMGLEGGYRGDVSPREVPPGSSPELLDVRFERRAIRKDWGWTPVGLAATNPVLVILEHKYIDANQSFARLIRIWRNGSEQAELDVWDGSAWVNTDTSTETINEIYLSAISALGCAYFADGQQVLEWCEVLQKIDQEDDFPAGNGMTLQGEEIVAVVSPGSSEVLDYQIAYDVIVNSSPGQDTTIVLEFYHENTLLGTRTHVIDQLETFPFSLLNQTFSFTRQITDLEEVSILVKSATGGGTTTELDNVITPSGGAPDVEGNKSPATQPAVDDKYRYVFTVSGGGCTVGFYYNRGSGWVLAHSEAFPDGAGQFTLTIPNFIESGAQFGFADLGGAGDVGDTQVAWDRSNADFEVHGHNKASQGDDPAGVFYQTTGAVVSQFQKIDPGPGGRFLEFFARRLVVLRNYGDTQALTWSADGVLNDFESEGSGEIILVEARSDPIDDLQGTAVLSSNFMALFRKRSIMRVFETGNVALALGAVSWIEDLGTNSPFSIKTVKGGTIFLGHDLMVYFLTEQGPQPIGQPIHQDLIETVTARLDLVDAGWDPTFGEYYLGVPIDGGEIISKVWIFDVDRFLQRNEIVWRPRNIQVQRFGSAGATLAPIPGPSGTFTRTTSGLLARYIQNSGTIPFDAADWTASPNSNGVSIQSGRLRFQGGASSVGRWCRHSAVSGRGKQFIHALVRCNGPAETPNSAGTHGIIAHKAANTDDDHVVHRVFSQVEWTGGGAGENSRNVIGTIELDNNSFLDSDTQQFTYLDQHQAADDYKTARRMSLFVDGTLAKGYEFFKDLETQITAVRTTGEAGAYSRWASGVSQVYTELESWFQFTDKDITVLGLPDGWTIEVQTSGSSVLGSGISSGGVATVDVFDDRMTWPGPAKVVVKDLSAVEFDSISPSDGVWGGDIYEFV